jgi:hypothetical protein
MLERALRGFEEALGPERVKHSIFALDATENFATIYAKQGRVGEARTLYVRCQTGRKTGFSVQEKRYSRAISKLESSEQDV